MLVERGTQAILVLSAVLLLAAAPTETTTLKDITQINVAGFGTSANKYAFSMAVFKDALYVGTLNVKNMPSMFDFFAALPLRSGTEGAEIWRYAPDGTWTRVVDKGLHDRRNFGVRKLAVINDCLYGVTANHDQGMEVWRTCDGNTWDVVADRGFGDKHNTSGRGLGAFKGAVYVGTEDRLHGAQIWRSADGKKWERTIDAGLGDPGNVWVSDLVEFKGELYLGTLNLSKGGSVFRSHDGEHFERVATAGLSDKRNRGMMKLMVFKDKLFVASMNFSRGACVFMSEDGVNFTPVLEQGLISKTNAYIWQLQEYNGRLYAGTYNHRLPIPTGAFMLFSSADGQEWKIENTDGFGDRGYYGLRTMALFQDQLIIGTASARYGAKVYAARSK
jgi:hypothetical protein